MTTVTDEETETVDGTGENDVSEAMRMHDELGGAAWAGGVAGPPW